jgi:hypothetical protein
MSGEELESVFYLVNATSYSISGKMESPSQ